MKIGFYIAGQKGYFTLVELLKKFDRDSVSFVVIAKDEAIDHDWYREIHDFCSKYNLIAVERKKINDENILDQSDIDVIFAIGWRWMINRAEKLIVFHDSLLPKYRGFSPLVNMLIDGADKIGVTALLASDQYDSGEIIAQKKKKISYPIKIQEAINEIVPLYAEISIKIANEINSKGTISSVAQDDGKATYSLWRGETDYRIDWRKSAEEIKRFVDAVGAPYKGASVLLLGRVLRVFDVEVVRDVVIENRKDNCGKVIFMDEGAPVVVCSQGLLRINDIKTEDNESLVGKIAFRSKFTK